MYIGLYSVDGFRVTVSGRKNSTQSETWPKELFKHPQNPFHVPCSFACDSHLLVLTQAFQDRILPQPLHCAPGKRLRRHRASERDGRPARRKPWILGSPVFSQG